MSELSSQRTDVWLEAERRKGAACIWLFGLLFFTVCALAAAFGESEAYISWTVNLLLIGFCAGGVWCAWMEYRRLKARERSLLTQMEGAER